MHSTPGITPSSAETSTPVASVSIPVPGTSVRSLEPSIQENFSLEQGWSSNDAFSIAPLAEVSRAGFFCQEELLADLENCLVLPSIGSRHSSSFDDPGYEKTIRLQAGFRFCRFRTG